ncbi:MAG: LCP family protein, partial [Bacilli bacterium]
KDISKDVNVTKDSFNIYISGIDTYGAITKTSRSDVNIVATVNPNTNEILLTSIPRDYYVTLPSFLEKDKLTHAGIYGIDESVGAIENLLDIKINYYVKVNFTSLIKIVDTLDGITVNSKYDFTSEDGYKYKKGINNLNGEEALAYARSRHSYIGGDLDRVRHQQQIVEAVGKKIVSFDSVSKFQDILSAISNNISTNMETPKILSGYKVMKNMFKNALGGSDFININKAYLETYSLPVYLPWTGGNTSAQGYYEDSLADIQDALKITLEKKAEPVIKTFSFSVN